MNSLRIGLFLPLAVAADTAQPAINIVQNAASVRQGLPNPTLAPGAIVAIVGQNLGPAAPVQAAPANPKTQLGGTTVQIASGSYSNNAVVLLASATEVDFILPADTPIGAGTAAVGFGSQSSSPASFNVARASFSAFTLDTQDTAANVMQSLLTQAQIPLNNLNGLAKAGQSLTLVGTGLGGTSDVKVMIGTVPATVTSSGPEQCCTGLDVIQFTVPDSAAGCVMPLVVKTGDTSNVVAPISIDTGKFCPYAGGFSPDDVAKAQANGSLKLGYLFLLRFSNPTGQQGFDMGFANFSTVTYDQIKNFHSVENQQLPGTCYAGSTNGQQQFAQIGSMPGLDFFAEFYPFGNTTLDAGALLNVTPGAGVGGSAQTLTQQAPGVYFGLLFNQKNPLTSFLQPGAYTLDNGNGGSDVPGFQATFNINPVIAWTNAASLTAIDRSKDLQITWQGGAIDDRVLVMVYSAAVDASFNVVAGIAACSQLASVGQLTIPASYLSLLPAANAAAGGGFIAFYSESVPSRFQPSAGVDAGYIVALGYSTAAVQVQ